MHHHYPTSTVVLTAALGLLVAPLLAQPMKPTVSTDIPLNPYKLPPFPVEVLHVKALLCVGFDRTGRTSNIRLSVTTNW